MADVGIVSAARSLASVTPARFPELRPGEGDFGAALRRVVSDVNTAQLKAQESAVQLAAGKPGDTVQALTTIQKADISFQFALQIRNKLLEAYQDVMRMSV